MKHTGRLLAIVFLFTYCISSAAAGPLDDGLAAYKIGDYATALRLWRPLAEQGNVAAQAFLGMVYTEGQAVPQDFAQAAAWYRKAAEQGQSAAQLYLGGMYANGLGVLMDYALAVIWYRKAGEQGSAEAQLNLGRMYEHGQGVLQDYVQAYLWYDLAAGSQAKSFPEEFIRDQAAAWRDGIAANMTAVQLAEARKHAREWKPVMK